MLITARATTAQLRSATLLYLNAHAETKIGAGPVDRGGSVTHDQSSATQPLSCRLRLSPPRRWTATSAAKSPERKDQNRVNASQHRAQAARSLQKPVN
ncbi:hypothetical protein BaRGS_00021723 [Batillaria attramentaria]|uniref:Uncharacterized protein n=1 Tax=Batillaria attramentaria TaxID=370345 RepID=A0ABD0KJ83_9CAEN